MQKQTVTINGVYIQIDSLLKLSEIVSSGGEAHSLVAAGKVKINNKLISEKRKKVYAGDIVIVDNSYSILVKINED